MKNRIFLILFLVFCTLGGFTVNEVVIKPFPFLTVQYDRGSEWNKSPGSGFFKTRFKKSDFNLSKGIQKELAEYASRSVNEKIAWATNLSRHLQQVSSGHKLRNKENIFSSGSEFLVICSESSKIFVTAMELLGVPARVIWMHGHTVSEIYNGDKWILIDVYGNVRAHDKSGNPLGIQDVLQGYDGVVFSKIVDDPKKLPSSYLDSDYFARKDNVYAKQSLVLAVDNSSLFDFHIKTRNPELIIGSIFGVGSSPVGRAVQLVLNDPYLVGNFGFGLVNRIIFAVN